MERRRGTSALTEETAREIVQRVHDEECVWAGSASRALTRIRMPLAFPFSASALAAHLPTYASASPAHRRGPAPPARRPTSRRPRRLDADPDASSGTAERARAASRRTRSRHRRGAQAFPNLRVGVRQPASSTARPSPPETPSDRGSWLPDSQVRWRRPRRASVRMLGVAVGPEGRPVPSAPPTSRSGTWGHPSDRASSGRPSSRGDRLLRDPARSRSSGTTAGAVAAPRTQAGSRSSRPGARRFDIDLVRDPGRAERRRPHAPGTQRRFEEPGPSASVRSLSRWTLCRQPGMSTVIERSGGSRRPGAPARASQLEVSRSTVAPTRRRSATRPGSPSGARGPDPWSRGQRSVPPASR